MKAITYMETSRGAKMLYAISPASIDPLETTNAAAEFAQAQPKFKELKARINGYNDYLSKCKADGVNFKSDDTIPPKVKAELRQRLSVISEYQVELLEIQNARAKDAPIYFTPAHSILVDDPIAAEIESKAGDGAVIEIVIDGDGDYMGFEVLDSKVGTKYRLPDTLDWLIIAEPDEALPTNAVFEAPDEAEARRIEVKRVSTLTPDKKESEKAACVAGAKQTYSLAIIATELEDGDEAINAARTRAREAYDSTIKDINRLYG